MRIASSWLSPHAARVLLRTGWVPLGGLLTAALHLPPSPPRRTILSDEKARSLTSHSTDFWIMVAALNRFLEAEGQGQLPLEGSIPDMTATTDMYIRLQKVGQLLPCLTRNLACPPHACPAVVCLPYHLGACPRPQPRSLPRADASPSPRPLTSLVTALTPRRSIGRRRTRTLRRSNGTCTPCSPPWAGTRAPSPGRRCGTFASTAAT